MGGEGGAVVSEGRVAEAVGTEVKLTSDGEEEEPGLPRDIAVRGGVGSIDATPTGPGSRGAATWFWAEREAEDAGETKGPMREGVVEVTAPVVLHRAGGGMCGCCWGCGGAESWGLGCTQR